MYGKLPFGASSWNSTVLASVAFAESFESTPANVDSAFEPFFGSDSALIEDATSSAVMGRAVVELDALADLERPHAAVGVRLPALGEARLELQLAVRPRQELAASGT